MSEADALGRRNQVRRTFRLALALFLILGVLSFLVMFFGSEQLAGLMNDSMAAPGIRALAPAVICVGCLSAFRGYAQGHGNMTPTAVSQIIEALCKLTVGLGWPTGWWATGRTPATPPPAHHRRDGGHHRGPGLYADELFDHPQPGAPAGRRPARRAVHHPQAPADDRRPHHHQFLHGGIVTVIDTSLVQGQLQRALLENQDTWTLYQDFVDFASLKEALSAWQAALPDGSAVSMSLLGPVRGPGRGPAGSAIDIRIGPAVRLPGAPRRPGEHQPHAVWQLLRRSEHL